MKTYKKVYHIKSPIEKVWKALVDANEIDNWGAGPVEMDGDVGTEFSLWGGDIHGTNIEVIAEEKLIQDWFGGEWDEPSRVTISLTPEDNSTRIDLLHENIPDSEYRDIAEGWDQYYFGPMKEYLEMEEGM